MIIKKFSFIYIFLCLCGNREKYELVKKLALMDEENELLREKFTEQLRNIKKLYDHGDLILN